MKKMTCFFLLCAFLATTLSVTAKSKGKEFEKLGKHFLLLLHKGKVKQAEALLGSRMKAAMPGTKLKAFWSKTQSQVGTFQGITETKSKAFKKYQIVLLFVKFKLIPLMFRIVFDEKTKKVVGFFAQPMVRSTKSSYRPPKYANKKRFIEKQIRFGEKGWRLPGTLTLPKGVKKPPVVILVHGSGPNDRDESIGDKNKPFKDIAWGLASRGIAVFRYDKRTFAHKKKYTKQVLEKVTLDNETTDDAVHAVKKMQTVLKGSPIYVLGHSQGAYAGAAIAKEAKGLTGLILAAAPAFRFEDLILRQVKYLSFLDGRLNAVEKKKIDMAKQHHKQVKDFYRSKKMIKSSRPFGIVRSFWQHVAAYDVQKETKSLTIPVLLLHGGRDYQVSMRSWKAWNKTLKGKKNVTKKLFPTCNHLFLKGKGKPNPKEYFLRGHVSLDVIRTITTWVKKRK